MNERIESFRGKHRFLSNYAPSPVRLNDVVYPTAEHAFAAFKTTEVAMRAAIAQLPTPGAARNVGRSRIKIELPDGEKAKLMLRTDWEQIKDEVMYRIVRAKFRQNRDLGDLLVATYDSELVEGTSRGTTGHVDTVWGVDLTTGTGENRLGKILMRVRAELREALVPA